MKNIIKTLRNAIWVKARISLEQRKIDSDEKRTIERRKKKHHNQCICRASLTAVCETENKSVSTRMYLCRHTHYSITHMQAHEWCECIRFAITFVSACCAYCIVHACNLYPYLRLQLPNNVYNYNEFTLLFFVLCNALRFLCFIVGIEWSVCWVDAVGRGDSWENM